MNEADPSAHPEAGPLPSEKILALSELLDDREIPYAFGGAIALFYYRDPRSTIDIDVNIFLPPEQRAEVVEALGSLYPLDSSKVSAEIEAEAQTRSMWGDTYVDLFFANTHFHTQMAERKRRQPFLEMFVLPADARFDRWRTILGDQQADR